MKKESNRMFQIPSLQFSPNWIQVLVMIWVVRHVLVIFGGFTSSIIHMANYFGADSPSPKLRPYTINYKIADENHDFILFALSKNIPVVVKGFPYLAAKHMVMSHTQLKKLTRSDTVDETRLSSSSEFTYYYNQALWSKQYDIPTKYKTLRLINYYATYYLSNTISII